MRILLLAAATAVSLAACSSAPPKPPIPTHSTAKQAVANLASSSGSLVSGKVTLVPMTGGVHLTGTVGGLPPNSTHGFHVHEKGDCSADDASSAGGHFNPTAQAHGSAESSTHHSGDMDNIKSDASGTARVSFHIENVGLADASATDINGLALVVHAKADDYKTQPSGNSGARIACGVITLK